MVVVRSRRRGLPGVRWGGPGRVRPLLLLRHPGPPAADAARPGGGGGRLPGRRPAASPAPRLQGRPGGRGAGDLRHPPRRPGRTVDGGRPDPARPDASAPDGTWWRRCRPPAGRSARRPTPWSSGCPPWPSATGRCWCADRSRPAICGPPAAGSRWRPRSTGSPSGTGGSSSSTTASPPGRGPRARPRRCGWPGPT